MRGIVLVVGRAAADNNKTAEAVEGSHGNIAASVLATLHRPYDLRRGHGASSRPRDHGSQGIRPRPDTDPYLRGPDRTRDSRPDAEEPRCFTKLSDLGSYPISARRDQAGNAAVFLREREGRHAVQPRHPRGDLP